MTRGIGASSSEANQGSYLRNDQVGSNPTRSTMKTVEERWLAFIKEYPVALQLCSGPRDLEEAVKLLMKDAFMAGAAKEQE